MCFSDPCLFMRRGVTMHKIPNVILLVDSGRASGRSMISGITKYIQVYGPWIFFPETSYYRMIHSKSGGSVYSAQGKRELHRLLRSGKFHGILADIPDAMTARSLIPKGFPAVLIPGCELVQDYPSLTCQSEHSGTLAAEYFLDLGFTHFAFCGYARSVWSRIRLESFQQRLGAAGYSPHVHCQRSSTIKKFWEQELDDLVPWLRGLPKPLALWAFNDDFASIVVEACRILDLTVPDEVAVLGADNDELICDLCNPPLSSIALNHEQVGYHMAELLNRQMRGEPLKRNTIELRATHVVSRQSTTIQATQDPEVARALRFIREHSRRPLQVDDVLKVVAVSRRSLYDRFHHVLGRSIQAEIRKCRIELIAKALVTTHDSIAQIAAQFGFDSPDHFSRYFYSVKKQTPLRYRKDYSLQR